MQSPRLAVAGNSYIMGALSQSVPVVRGHRSVNPLGGKKRYVRLDARSDCRIDRYGGCRIKFSPENREAPEVTIICKDLLRRSYAGDGNFFFFRRHLLLAQR